MLSSETFAHGIGLLAARWPQAKAPELQGIYAQYLGDLGEPEFIAAVKQAVATHDFLPSAKAIRDLARPQVSHAVEAGALLTTILADRSLTSYSPAAGTGYSLAAIAEKYGDAAARAVVAIGGAWRLGQITEAALPHEAKRFAEAYAGYAGELATRAAGQRLGAPVERPRLASGAPANRPTSIRSLVDRALPPGDQ